MLQWLHANGFPEFYSNPNRFGIDLIANTSPMVGIELEHRDEWCREIFPFALVNIPARKQRRLGNRNVHYVVINKDFTMFGLCIGQILSKYTTLTYTGGNKERYLKVPRNEFIWKCL